MWAMRTIDGGCRSRGRGFESRRQSCHAAKELLSSHGMTFTARNIMEDPGARDEVVARTGRMAVPVITIDDEVVVGFDRGRLKRLLHL
jgi:glutaredoxin